MQTKPNIERFESAIKHVANRPYVITPVSMTLCLGIWLNISKAFSKIMDRYISFVVYVTESNVGVGFIP